MATLILIILRWNIYQANFVCNADLKYQLCEDVYCTLF